MKTNTVRLIGLMLIAFSLSAAPVRAQGFASILSKLESLEKRLSTIESSQRNTLKQVQSQIAKQEEDIQLVRQEITGIQPGESNNSLAMVETQIARLTTEMESVKTGALNKNELDEVRELALAVRNMITDLETSGLAQQQTTEPSHSVATGLAPEVSSSVIDVAEKIEIATEAAVVNQYVWRGIRLTNGAVVQPSVTLGGGNFSFNVWANMDISEVNGLQKQVSELDFTLDYSFSLGNYGLSIGAIEYTFPHTEFNSTTELYLGLGVDILLGPSVTVYQDIDEANGTYVSLGFGHSLALEQIGTSLDLSAALGWGSASHNSFYYGVDKNLGTDIYLGASLPLSVGERFTVTPSIGYGGLLSGEIREAADKKDHLIGGLNISASF